MTASGIPRLYWDTSVFLCFLSEEEEERRLICEDVLHAGNDGKVEIVTSMFTLVEVIRPKAIKHLQPLTDEQVSKLRGMFRWPWLKKIQVHEQLALEASDLARVNRLKPADTIHAATAIAEKCDELRRWDRDFNNVASLISVTSPAYVSQMLLLQVKAPIGPTPSDFTPTASSTCPPPPSSQSPVVEKPKASSPEPAPPSAPPTTKHDRDRVLVGPLGLFNDFLECGED